MHNLLEQYLSEVASRLSPLPVARRNEELREMRQHLQNAVIVNKEFGQSEDEAIQSAIEQFGVPDELGASVVGVWKRGEKNANKHSLWGAAACTLALANFLPGLTQTVAHLLFRYTDPGNFPIWAEIMTFVFAFAGPALVGGISALVFPKRAVAGTALAMAAHTLGTLTEILLLHTAAPSNLSMEVKNGIGSHPYLITLALIWLINVPTTLLSAWLVSCWRGRQTRFAIS